MRKALLLVLVLFVINNTCLASQSTIKTKMKLGAPLTEDELMLENARVNWVETHSKPNPEVQKKLEQMKQEQQPQQPQSIKSKLINTTIDTGLQLLGL